MKILFLFFISVAFCQSCTKNKIEDFGNGEFTLVGLFPMNCSFPNEIDNRSIAWIEAMKYTVVEANKFFNYNIFNYVIYDTYDPINMDMTSLAVLDSFKILETNTCSSCQLNKRLDSEYDILGFVGPSESSTSIYVHQLTTPYENFPIISYAAVSDDLNDQTLYPNLFRMLPDDNSQSEFIMKVLKKYRWTYISLVAVDSSYGRGGLEVSKLKYEKEGICFDVLEILPQAYDLIRYTKIATKLKGSKATVIIFWGQYKPLQNLLHETTKTNITSRTWILSKAVGKNVFFFNFEKKKNDTFLFVVETMGEDELFKDFFYSLNFKNSSQSLKVIFKKYGVDENNLSFNAGEIKEVFDLSGVAAVQNAVKVFIESFCQYQGISCNRKLPTKFQFQKINNRTKLREIIKEISFNATKNSKNFRFNSKQNSDLVFFELFTYFKSEFSLLDRWSFNATNLDIINNTKQNLSEITSICSIPCPPGYKKIVSLAKCCWNCSACLGNTKAKDDSCMECEIDSFSNPEKTDCIKHQRIFWSFNYREQSLQQVGALVFSCIGVLITLVFVITFVKNKSTPIVRSCYFELSLIQMIMHLIWFLLQLLVFGEESELKCQIRIYFGSFIHVVIVTILLAKTTRLVGIFSFPVPSNLLKEDKLYLRFKVAVVLVFFPCIYISIIFVAQYSRFKIDVSDVQDMTLFTVEKYCDSTSFSIIHLCFALTVSFFCGLQCFKGRKLPEMYNENKFIAYSLFFSNIMLCVIIMLNSSNLYLGGRKLAYCLLTTTSNILLISMLFFYRVKLIWMNPRLNTKIEFHRNRFNGIYRNEHQSSINSNSSSLNLVCNTHYEL
ncbi:extracellular calcium-sensing receptor-like [Hydra vulgaris]|uniref:Extracellular calcium-sensing receptor-like n=1 Tax=Hydra vulgaris TaxID=6087 RepID=A0ABM4CBC5_HYDVU